MIYKFKVWVWLPQVTEIYLSAENDDHAVSNFNKLDLNDFWDINFFLERE